MMPATSAARLARDREHDEGAATVIVVDDDAHVREAIEALLRSVGLQVELYGSVKEFRDREPHDRHGCLVLDVRLPGLSGLDLHDDLLRSNVQLPVVFISGHADVPMSVRAMKAGAVEFLTKPVRHQDLLDAIQQAIAQDRARREGERNLAAVRAAFEVLSTREREVMAQVVRGRLNKQIAGDIGISEATVKQHRSQVMRKMRARSLAALIRMADKLGVSQPD